MTARLEAAFLHRSDVQRVFRLLNDAGEEVRVVGGAVRNALLDLPIADIDMATTALPARVMHLAQDAGVKVVPTGIDHGTVTLVLDGVPFEVTTLREDVETDGRHAVVRFGRDFAKDAFRRDFTINALSVAADGVLHDYASGLDDIAARRVRFIGAAEARIREDYLRILRFFRFSAVYGVGLEPVGLSACIRLRTGLLQLSRERIRQELLKTLAAPGAIPVLDVMNDTGLLGLLTGGVAQMARLKRAAMLMGALPAPVVQLMALSVLIGEDIQRLRDRLRLTNQEQARLDTMLLWRGKVRFGDEAALKVLLYRLGPEAYRDVIADSAMFDLNVTPEVFHDALSLPSRWTAPKFPLSGRDMMARGMAPGPTIAKALQEAEAAWITAGMPDRWS